MRPRTPLEQFIFVWSFAALLLIAAMTSGRSYARPSVDRPHDGSTETLTIAEVEQIARGTSGEGRRRKSLPRDEIDILARGLLGEVAKQSDVEVRAVARVIFNRWRSGRYGPTLTDTVLYRSKRGTWAFTAFSRKHASPERNVWADWLSNTRAYRRMVRLINEEWQSDGSHNYSNYFHPNAMPKGRKPPWARGKKLVKIGSAMFCRCGG